jgi:hypothetical protein
MTDALRATGLRDPDRTQSIYTVNPSIGGPLIKDKLWFYGGYSRMYNERLKAGTYFNTDLAAWRPASIPTIRRPPSRKPTMQISD